MLPRRLPLFFEALTDSKSEFPNTYPFHVYFDQRFGMYRQKASENLKSLLKRVYLAGSMLSGEMNPHANKHQADAAVDFIKRIAFPYMNNRKKILEIGCGNGYLLERLSKFGAVCIGLEPGDQIKKVNTKRITVIQDFFPSNRIKEKFHLILHFNVLEHVEDPVTFLKKQKELLTKDGIIIFAVPNCEPDLVAGDIAIFRHEHFSYFSRFSIHKAIEEAGLFLEAIEHGAFGGLLFAKAVQKKVVKEKRQFTFFPDTAFETKRRIFFKKVNSFLESSRQSDVAVYCPMRAMNILYTQGITDCRFVDDSRDLYKKHIPTFKKAIENFTDLKNNPPQKLLIYSRTFGERIFQKCVESNELKKVKIKKISDF